MDAEEVVARWKQRFIVQADCEGEVRLPGAEVWALISTFRDCPAEKVARAEERASDLEDRVQELEDEVWNLENPPKKERACLT